MISSRGRGRVARMASCGPTRVGERPFYPWFHTRVWSGAVFRPKAEVEASEAFAEVEAAGSPLSGSKDVWSGIPGSQSANAWKAFIVPFPHGLSLRYVVTLQPVSWSFL